VKSLGGAALFVGLISYASVAHAQVANSQSDGRDYEALAYLPKDTLVALTYFREVSTADKASYSQTQGIFRASYILKYGNLSIVPFDALLPVVDVAAYVQEIPMSPATTVLHTSGIGDFTYLPTVGYTITENKEEQTHTVLAATMYFSAPWGSYNAAYPISIGDNRWRFQPQVGVSQRFLKIATLDLVGSLAFYTTNPASFTPMGYVSLKQSQTFGLEAHATVDLSPDLYAGLSYYFAGIGERDDFVPPSATSPGGTLPFPPSVAAQNVQTVRFTFGIRAEKATLLLLQYNQDVAETGGATASRFIGARLSHAIFF
jgi:hypothetical protein